jgi:hypothetical protein
MYSLQTVLKYLVARIAVEKQRPHVSVLHLGLYMPLVMVTSFVFWPSPKASSVSFIQKKISKKFCGIWTSFGTDILKNQKQAKNSNWHWALS